MYNFRSKLNYKRLRNLDKKCKKTIDKIFLLWYYLFVKKKLISHLTAYALRSFILFHGKVCPVVVSIYENRAAYVAFFIFRRCSQLPS